MFLGANTNRDVPRQSGDGTAPYMGLQMSFAQTFNSFQAINLTAGQKLVLAGISTFTDSTGKGWPSVATIATRCSMAVRTVQRHIAALVSLGYLDRIYRTGRAAVTRVKLGVTTPAKLAPPPPPNWHPESAIESVNEITAQPAAPVVAESPASAAVVVFESMATEVTDPVPVVDVVPDLPVVDVPAVATDTLPVVDNPLASVPAALLDDFGIVRKAKKKAAVVTRTEAVVFASEAAKAGMTVAQAVETCIMHGWSRFESAWMPAAAPAMAPQSFYVPEVAPPASLGVINAGRAAIAAMRETINRQVIGKTAWATAAMAKAAAGEHVAPATLAAARVALRI